MQIGNAKAAGRCQARQSIPRKSITSTVTKQIIKLLIELKYFYGMTLFRRKMPFKLFLVEY